MLVPRPGLSMSRWDFSFSTLLLLMISWRCFPQLWIHKTHECKFAMNVKINRLDESHSQFSSIDCFLEGCHIITILMMAVGSW